MKQYPSRHDHVGSMVYEPESCHCTACGQRWVLRRDANGQPVSWQPQPRRTSLDPNP